MIAVVGGHGRPPQVASRLFDAVGRAGKRPPHRPGHEELNIVLGVADSDYDRAMQAIFDSFFFQKHRRKFRWNTKNLNIRSLSAWTGGRNCRLPAGPGPPGAYHPGLRQRPGRREPGDGRRLSPVTKQYRSHEFQGDFEIICLHGTLTTRTAGPTATSTSASATTRAGSGAGI